MHPITLIKNADFFVADPPAGNASPPTTSPRAAGQPGTASPAEEQTMAHFELEDAFNDQAKIKKKQRVRS